METCPQCGNQLEKKVLELFGEKKEVFRPCECVKKENAKREAEEVEKGRIMFRERARREAGLKTRQRKYTFSGFEPDAGSKAAYDAAIEYTKQIIETDGKGIANGISLYGSVGNGKTHLACAIINGIITKHKITETEALHEFSGFMMAGTKMPRWVFSSTVDMLAEIKATYDSGENTQDIISKYKNAKVLVLDDVAVEKCTEWAQERLFEIIDHRYNELLPLVVTTNATPKEIQDRLGERIADRLREMCKVVPITSKSHRESA